jgi:hypothetical protein
MKKKRRSSSSCYKWENVIQWMQWDYPLNMGFPDANFILLIFTTEVPGYHRHFLKCTTSAAASEGFQR